MTPASPARAPRDPDPARRQIEALAARAADLFASGSMLCAPAVLTVLNRSLGGGLPPGLDKALAAALPEGQGGAGCLCGALGGAQLALGLFLGGGLGGQRRARRAAAELHDAFRDRAGATCCRVLSKQADGDQKARLAQCAELTGLATALAAGAILRRRPELLAQALPAPAPRRAGLGGRLRRLAGVR